jgi:Ca2+-binding EF-hand superfamily protein
MRVRFASITLPALLAVGLAAAQERPEKAPPRRADTPPGKPLQFDVDRFFKDFDRNQDGYLQRDELPPDLRPAFDRIDTNKDGKISREELAAGMAYLQPRRRPSDLVYMLIEMSDFDEDARGEVQRAYDILRSLDKNNDGKIDLDELKAARERIVRQRVDALFQQLDTDKDGRISREEARGQIREHFKEIDRNGDGFIDRDELLRAAREKPGVPPPEPKSERRAPAPPPER